MKKRIAKKKPCMCCDTPTTKDVCATCWRHCAPMLKNCTGRTKRVGVLPPLRASQIPDTVGKHPYLQHPRAHEQPKWRNTGS